MLPTPRTLWPNDGVSITLTEHALHRAEERLQFLWLSAFRADPVNTGPLAEWLLGFIAAAFARRGNLRGMRLLKKTGQRGGGVLTRVILDVPLTRANRESDLLSRAEALQRLAGELSSDPPRRARQPSKKNTLPGANPDDPHNLKPLISRYAPAKPTRPTSAS
jgi:hypothetical protein